MLPDESSTCEASGERPRVLVAEGGEVRLWHALKNERTANKEEPELHIDRFVPLVPFNNICSREL